MTTFYFSRNQLWRGAAAKLVFILGSIDPSVTTLEASSNDLWVRSVEDLVEIFRAIPPGVTTLDLSQNKLWRKSATELAEILRAIPSSVTTLDLSLNDLWRKSGTELVEILRAISPTVTRLKLCWNDLWCESRAELVEILGAIPSSVTTLDLCWDEGWPKSGMKLVETLRIIPLTVTTLNLSWKELWHKSSAELVEILRAVPASVTTVNLSWLDLWRKSATEIVEILDAIPASVTMINLTSNDLFYKSGTEIVEILRAIPPSVTTLDLTGSWLSRKSAAELAEIIRAIPPSVTTLILPRIENLEDRIQYDVSLPPNSQNLQDLIEREIKYLILIIGVGIRDQSTYPYFKFRTVPFSINESDIGLIISNLKQLDTPLTNLIAAMLLEGRITNQQDITQDFDLKGLIEYRRKMLAAVSFYQKVTGKPLKEIAEFLLFHMKATTYLIPVRQRLEDVKAAAIFKIYNKGTISSRWSIEQLDEFDAILDKILSIPDDESNTQRQAAIVNLKSKAMSYCWESSSPLGEDRKPILLSKLDSITLLLSECYETFMKFDNQIREIGEERPRRRSERILQSQRSYSSLFLAEQSSDQKLANSLRENVSDNTRSKRPRKG